MSSKRSFVKSSQKPEAGSDEDEELLERYEHLEQLKKIADQTGERYIVGTTSAGDLALIFPDKNVTKIHPLHESIPLSQQQPLATKPEPEYSEFSIKDYIFAMQRKEKEKEGGNKIQTEKGTWKRAQEEEESRKRVQEEEALEEDSPPVKNTSQNFKISFTAGNKLIIREFDYVTPDQEHKQSELEHVPIKIKKELEFDRNRGELVEVKVGTNTNID